jgi:hypothetical protein
LNSSAPCPPSVDVLPDRRIVFCILFALAAIALGGKFLLIRAAGNEVPYWDAWDGEGIRIYAPSAWGKLEWKNFFDLHNEHRPALSRGLNFGVFLLNNRMWDARPQMIVNAFLHLSALAILLLAIRPGLPLVAWAWVGAVSAGLLAAPVGWYNTVIGFQSQFHFLLLCAFGHLALSLSSTPRQVRWWLGQVMGVAGLFSMASGFLSGAALIAMATLRACKRRETGIRLWANLAVGAALIAAGWCLKKEMPYHDNLRVTSVGQFLDAFAHILTWPFHRMLFGALLVHLPTAWFFVHLWRDRRETPAADWVLGGFATWCLLQNATLAYQRSQGGDLVFVDRYFDLYASGLAVAAACLARLYALSRLPRRWLLYGLGWTAWVGAGIVIASFAAWQAKIIPFIEERAVNEARLLRYTQSGDPSVILLAPDGELPYPKNNPWLLHLLAIPEIAATLPPSVRTAVAVPPPASGFRLDGLPPDLAARTLRAAYGNWLSGSSRVPARWQSGLLPTRFPFIRMRIACDPMVPPPVVALEFADGRERRVPAGEFSSTAWRTVNLYTGRQPCSLRIEAPTGGWVGFTAPVEVGPLSWLAGKPLKFGLPLLCLGLAVLGATVGLAFRQLSAGKNDPSRDLPRDEVD